MTPQSQTSPPRQGCEGAENGRSSSARELIWAFETGDPAGFQGFLADRVGRVERAWHQMVASEGGSGRLTNKVSDALFDGIRAKIASPQFEQWVREVSAQVALHHPRENRVD